jgi:outer membrane protein
MKVRRWLFAGVLAFAGLPQSARSQEAPPGPAGAGSSLTLMEALALALDTHPALGQADAAGTAAGARVDQAKAATLPTLATQGTMAQYQEPMVVAPLHGFDPMSPPAFDRSLVQGAISAGYTLYDGGVRRARILGAEAGERAVAAGGTETRRAVLVQVSAAYLGILSGQELLAAVESQRQSLDAELGRVRLFLEEGKAARVDLLRVEAALSQVEAQEISARSDLEVYRNRLARLTGLDAGEVRGARLAPVRARPTVSMGGDMAVTAALEANAFLHQAREELRVARTGVSAAQARWRPKIEAAGGYLDFGTLDGGHVQEWRGSLKISYPLFLGGARQSEEAQAVAEERRAEEALRLAELTVADEVDTALAAVAETRALREALERGEARSEEVARIEALALDAGAGVQTDFLRAQAELFQARAALAQARHGEILARIELARVAGELSLDWIQDNMEMER